MWQKRSHVDSSCIDAWNQIWQHIYHSNNGLVFCQYLTANVQHSCVACCVYTGKKTLTDVCRFLLWLFQSLIRTLVNNPSLYSSTFVCTIHPTLSALCGTGKFKFLSTQLFFLRLTIFCTINIQCWFSAPLLAPQSIPFQGNITLLVIQ